MARCGEILMATLVAKDPPVGIPPGVKVLNDVMVEPSQPESCIMATAVGIELRQRLPDSQALQGADEAEYG